MFCKECEAENVCIVVHTWADILPLVSSYTIYTLFLILVGKQTQKIVSEKIKKAFSMDKKLGKPTIAGWVIKKFKMFSNERNEQILT